MPNATSTLRPSVSDHTRLEDGRADWERPALRRLAASEAQHKGDEGGGGGKGQGNHWDGRNFS